MTYTEREPTPSLPIDEYLSSIIDLLNQRQNLVLIAEPGAGKTTRIPPALLNAGFAQHGRILVLQPRRVAVRTTARRIAHELGTTVGDAVGYTVRFENRTSTNTHIEILTEGLFLRRLQSDPLLEDVSVVIFDEFHERSLNMDLSLAFTKEVQDDLRPDLRIVVMSATLDAGPISDWLGAAVVKVPGRTHPVHITYDTKRSDLPIPQQCANAIKNALNTLAHGHILCFLPGYREIYEVFDALQLLDDVLVLPLHGQLKADEQDKVFAPSTKQKVILATNIAETSITVEGVVMVIDSGLARVPRFDPAIGMERLVTERISLASADQRAGRAGRTGPGHCHRLWSQAQHRHLCPSLEPEVRRADLTPSILNAWAWGSHPDNIGWFERPPIQSLNYAHQILTLIGALNETGLTPQGRLMAQLPVHPRFARVLISAAESGQCEEGARLAAIVSERDIFYTPPMTVSECDLSLRMDVLQNNARGQPQPGLDSRALRNVLLVKEQLLGLVHGLLKNQKTENDKKPLVQHLLTGFPDRVARRRGGDNSGFLMANGHGARLHPASTVTTHDTILAVVVTGGHRGERSAHVIRMATAIRVEDLETSLVLEHEFDPIKQQVNQFCSRKYLALELGRFPAGEKSIPDEAYEFLAHKVAKIPGEALDIKPGSEVYAWLNRVRWLADIKPDLELPRFLELETPSEPNELVRRLCYGCRSFSELQHKNLTLELKQYLGFTLSSAVDTYAPSHLDLPDGSRRPLKYTPGEPPILSTRFERLFGLAETPKIGTVPITLELLAPNRRPIQVTRDLGNFWRSTYPQVRRELRGRYPKHPWPDDPLTAKPGFYRHNPSSR